MSPPKLPLGFLLAFRQHWFAAMSGGFSVPFTAAAIYLQNKYAQGIFGALAFSAAWFAAYRVWKVEHEKVANLEAQLGATKLREIEAQETHTAELRRHTDALERQYRPPALENMIESMRVKENDALSSTCDPNALKIVHANSPEFEKVQARQDYVIRTVIVHVQNTDQSHFISNCKFHVGFNSADYLFEDNFTLQPTEKRIVEIATHHEMEHDKWIHLHVRVPGGFLVNRGAFRIALSGALLTFKATSAETRPAQLICRIFVDPAGRLRMENV